MVYLPLRILVIPIALAVFPGCVSSQKNVDAARVSGADDRVNDPQSETKTGMETKVGVIDLMEVLKRTSVGRPALAIWKREAEEQTRMNPRHRTPYSSLKPLNTALASIMPKVETVAQTLAEKHDLAVVLQKGTAETIMITYYYAEMYDLTEQVIEELNRRHP